MKLTPAQRKVILLLQSGEVIIHDDRYFMVSDKTECHRIQWKVWQALTKELRLIAQSLESGWRWQLTPLGEQIKL